MKLIDIHNHILNGIDDGAKTSEDTLKMLQMAYETGIEKLIFTPHFKEGICENDIHIVNTKFNEAKKIIEDHHINLEVYSGCEIFLTRNSLDLLNQNTIPTLNNSKNILVETHRSNIYLTYDFDDEIYNLAVDGYHVIIAHPERYQFVHEDINKVFEYIKEGYMIQINVTSLYDSSLETYKIAKKLLDHNLVHFIASDAHDLVKRTPNLSMGYKMISQKYGEKRANDLFYNNQVKLLNNQEINLDFEKVKKRLWFF
ncbi:MAG: exopolysaccharide biosynthesis protein [Haloplasmataceae bacterium]|jgi:protein-tyrosine phosphatase|nr:exopolysaccharide biosynthesis protein [Haloplasmataceae bacterium]